MRTLQAQEPSTDGRLAGLLVGGRLDTAFQPIVEMRDHALLGMEALLRIDHAGTWAPPGPAFARAAATGMTLDLELAALRLALSRIDDLPDGVFLAVNAAPSTIRATAFTELLHRVDLRRVVVEITENEAIEDYGAINGCLDGLRGCGLRIAIDDAGAGVSSLRHILRLRPDLVKLDITLVDRICTDDFQRALIGALVRFTAELGIVLIAEGIEDGPQATALRDLGVPLGQGFALGRPAPLAGRR